MNSAFQPLFSINLLLEQKNCSSWQTEILLAMVAIYDKEMDFHIL